MTSPIESTSTDEYSFDAAPLEMEPLKYFKITRVVAGLGLFGLVVTIAVTLVKREELSRDGLIDLFAGSAVGSIILLFGLLYEGLIRLEHLYDHQAKIIKREGIEDNDRKKINHELEAVHARLEHVCRGLENLDRRVQLNRAYDLSQQLKEKYKQLSSVVKLLPERHIADLETMLSDNRPLYFDLTRTADKGSAIWKAFIASARHSFIGLQYWYGGDALGADPDPGLLRFQKERAEELQKARERVSTNVNTSYYTRVFVIRDGYEDHAWEAMSSQSKHGVKVRYVFASTYERIVEPYWEKIGSRDFCVIDRDSDEDAALLKARDGEVSPSLMVVKYDDKTAKKTAFEITTSNDGRLTFAQALLSEVLSEAASRAFKLDDYSTPQGFKQHVDAERYRRVPISHPSTKPRRAP